MFSSRIVIGRKAKDEGEKPFWISFADLMTALMVMFLLVMSVALLAVTKTVSEADRKKAERDRDIERIMTQIEFAAKNYEGITVDKQRNVIDYGDRARFESGSSQLSIAQSNYLREFVPVVLNAAATDEGKRWLKRVAVEGFADSRGDYLLNLNLSLQRSQRVLCVLLSPSITNAKLDRTLSQEQKEQVRDLFLVGGYSFNSAKKSMEESRRIEFRLEFFGTDEKAPVATANPINEFGVCRI